MIPPVTTNPVQFLIDLVGFTAQMIPRTPELIAAFISAIQTYS